MEVIREITLLSVALRIVSAVILGGLIGIVVYGIVGAKKEGVK